MSTIDVDTEFKNLVQAMTQAEEDKVLAKIAVAQHKAKEEGLLLRASPLSPVEFLKLQVKADQIGQYIRSNSADILARKRVEDFKAAFSLNLAVARRIIGEKFTWRQRAIWLLKSFSGRRYFE